MEGLRIVACFFSFVSLLLLIVALASDYWAVDPDGSSHVGLWRGCAGNTCISYGMRVAGYFHATRAFLFMGMVAGAISCFGLCTSFFRTHIGSISIKVLAVSASFVAGVCSLIAMSTFTGVYNDIMLFAGTGFGWSFGVGWASFPLFLITGGLAYKAISSTP
ncbi:PREDICTED: protein NKG7-like [Gekko japonicus]|uniref:Protein NKG7-like n=1 Tax=Gekko japonicus TaxID=146911 RepID=A0ABM1KBP5_GEKJA|nr:PREDICTED: protein NKG7-like [Gekko japonicus]XP_015271132.1 PREDICTED: protein NKG7-like [Gekko japonicus]